MSGRSRRGARGMVLIEVIMALTIFTCVAFGLIMALDSATDAAADRNRIDAATEGLENQMVQLSTTRLATTIRDLPSDGTQISYHVEIGPETLQDDQKKSFNGFYRITLRATWTVDRRTESRDLSQLVYQP